MEWLLQLCSAHYTVLDNNKQYKKHLYNQFSDCNEKCEWSLVLCVVHYYKEGAACFGFSCAVIYSFNIRTSVQTTSYLVTLRSFYHHPCKNVVVYTIIMQLFIDLAKVCNIEWWYISHVRIFKNMCTLYCLPHFDQNSVSIHIFNWSMHEQDNNNNKMMAYI